MSVGWDVKWCPLSRITTPLARKRPFHWISMESKLVRAAREPSTYQNWSLLTNTRRRYMTEILPKRRKHYPINQSINHLYITFNFKTIQVKWMFELVFRTPQIQTLIRRQSESKVNRTRINSGKSMSRQPSWVYQSGNKMYLQVLSNI